MEGAEELKTTSEMAKKVNIKVNIVEGVGVFVIESVCAGMCFVCPRVRVCMCKKKQLNLGQNYMGATRATESLGILRASQNRALQKFTVTDV